MQALSRTVEDNNRIIKVMIVDDSAVVRGLINRWISENPKMEVVGRSCDGKAAIADVTKFLPDIIILDVEMPHMDGLEALPQLLRAKPGVRVLMASSLTQRNAKISIEALSLGAHDYIPKPSSNSGLTTSIEFRESLIEKIEVLCGARDGVVGFSKRPIPDKPTKVSSLSKPEVTKSSATNSSIEYKKIERGVQSAALASSSSESNASLRTLARIQPDIIAIGSSTGGPQALQVLLSELASHVNKVPMVITQHMPPTFTKILAEHLTKGTGIDVSEATHDCMILPGKCYIAPGDAHFSLVKTVKGLQAHVADGPLINFCKPAVDPLFFSVSKIFGNKALGIILTGMGSDGALGALELSQKGANILAQDQESSVVWGMPKSAYMAGACAKLGNLPEIAKTTINLLRGGVV